MTIGHAKSAASRRAATRRRSPSAGCSTSPRSALAISAGSSVSTTIELPYWVKLVRQGDTFSGYLSKDGKDWHRVDDISVPMGKKIYVGLAVSAHNNTLLNSAMFDDVKVAK